MNTATAKRPKHSQWPLDTAQLEDSGIEHVSGFRTRDGVIHPTVEVAISHQKIVEDAARNLLIAEFVENYLDDEGGDKYYRHEMRCVALTSDDLTKWLQQNREALLGVLK